MSNQDLQKVIIAVRETGDMLVKVRPPLKDDPPVPAIGFQYFCCNLITSRVVNFKPIADGWEVQTENSMYRFFLGTVEKAEEIAKEMGLSGPSQLGYNSFSPSFYWKKEG